MTDPTTGPQSQPKALLWMRSAVFFSGQSVFTLVFSVVSVFSLALPYRVRYPAVTAWTHITLWWLRAICGLTHHAVGTENIPDRPCIIMAKHQSAWETLALQLYFSPQTWVLKRELLRVPFFGWGLATIKPIAIDRSSGKAAVSQVVDQGTERLKEGIWVVVFPEGTRTPPGQSGRYRGGGARLAEASGYDIVPVAHNSGDFWPRNSFLKHPGKVSLSIGPVINVAGKTSAELLAESERWIEDEVRRMRAPYSSERASRGNEPADDQNTHEKTTAR